jgi:hypothetical protein
MINHVELLLTWKLHLVTWRGMKTRWRSVTNYLKQINTITQTRVISTYHGLPSYAYTHKIHVPLCMYSQRYEETTISNM